MYSLAQIAEAMNSLDMVTWDRCVRQPSRGAVYGWITREDGRSDFVVLQWNTTGIGYTTSSAEHSRTIGERLAALMGGKPMGHTDCERVEDVFGELVERPCRIVAQQPPPADRMVQLPLLPMEPGDGESDGAERRPVDQPDDLDQRNPVDCSAEVWRDLYANNPDLLDSDQEP